MKITKHDADRNLLAGFNSGLAFGPIVGFACSRVAEIGGVVPGVVPGVLGGLLGGLLAGFAAGLAARHLTTGLLVALVAALTAGPAAGLVAGLTTGVAFGVALGASFAGLAGLVVVGIRERFRRRGGLTHPFARRQGSAGASATWQRWRACTWVDRLVGYLVDSSVRRLPEVLRDRYAEEWADHRARLRGLRLVWWAMCLRATASRTGQEYRRARLPHSGG